MKFFHTALFALFTATVVVEAAPAPVTEPFVSTALTKREDLERALVQLEELQVMRMKRDDLAAELTEREYAIVTEVLTAIKDTELAPIVLKFFVSNETLKNVAIDGILLVIKSGLISLESLLLLLVQSGLVTSVLNDVLGDCEVYASIINIAKSLIGSLFSKRDVPYTYEEGFELLKREGLIKPTEFDNFNADDLAKRDVTDIVVNLLESLALSGLATQVVETVLTDTTFLSFGAELIKELYTQGLLSLSSLVSAVTESGLLSQLLKEFLNFSTISTIFSTALSAFEGDCSATSTGSSSLSSSLAAAVSSSSSSGSSITGLLGSLLGGSSILSTAGSLLSSFLGSGSSSSSSTSSATTATVAAASYTVACSTALAKRERLRMY